MAQRLYEETYVRNLANAIRNVTENTDKLKISEMAAAVNNTFDSDGAMKEFINTVSWLLVPITNYLAPATDVTAEDLAEINRLIDHFKSLGGVDNG